MSKIVPHPKGVAAGLKTFLTVWEEDLSQLYGELLPGLPDMLQEAIDLLSVMEEPSSGEVTFERPLRLM